MSASAPSQSLPLARGETDKKKTKRAEDEIVSAIQPFLYSFNYKIAHKNVYSGFILYLKHCGA